MCAHTKYMLRAKVYKYFVYLLYELTFMFAVTS